MLVFITSGFLEAEPKTGILVQIIYWRKFSKIGVEGSRMRQDETKRS